MMSGKLFDIPSYCLQFKVPNLVSNSRKPQCLPKDFYLQAIGDAETLRALCCCLSAFEMGFDSVTSTKIHRWKH